MITIRCRRKINNRAFATILVQDVLGARLRPFNVDRETTSQCERRGQSVSAALFGYQLLNNQEGYEQATDHPTEAGDHPKQEDSYPESHFLFPLAFFR